MRTALIVWIGLLAAICLRCWIQPHKRSLYRTWEQAGAHWQAGVTVYRSTWDEDQDQFRYSPLVAALLVPFSHLPLRVGGVMWRLINAAVLLGGFAGWLRAVPAARTVSQKALLFLLIVPLALGSLNNGQPNPLVIGLLLAAVALLDRERWTAAAGCVALACALKVYPVVIGLLLAAAYPRRFAPRLLLALVAAALLPFAFQRWDYVTSQYGLWLHRLSIDQRYDWPLHMAYRDLWLLIRLCHLPVTPRAYQGLQVLAGAGCAVLCLAGRWRGWPRRQVLLAVLVLGSCWMTLCGPATESCTYVLLAPALAWAMQSARLDGWPRAVRVLPDAAFGLLMVCVLAGLVPWTGQIHALGLHPLAALLLSAGYLAIVLRALARATRRPVDGQQVPARAA